MKEEVISKYLDYPNLRVRFHAEKTDKDAEGHDICTFYAHASALMQVRDSLEVEAQRIEAQANLVRLQGENIVSTSERANESVNLAEAAKTKAETVESAQVQSDERLAEIRQQITLIDSIIKDLQNNVGEIIANDKGVFLSEATLCNKVAEPNDGDCASVAAPYYIEGGEFDPTTFWGENYKGDKAEHPEWVNDTASVIGIYYKSDGVLYEVIKPTTLQYIADTDHNPDTQMVEEGIVSVVTPIEVSADAQVPFLLYVANNGRWLNSHIVREFTSSATIQAHNVLDGEKKQQELNSANETNALLSNFNTSDIQNAINVLIHNFTALLEKVCVTGEIDIQPMKKVVLSRLIADGDGSNTRLDVCMLPITLS